MKLNIKTTLIAMITTLVISCSTRPVVQDFPPTANAPDEIQKLDANLQSAFAKQVNVLSPANFENANSALNKAKKRQSDGKDAKGTLELVAQGNAYLTQATNASQLSHTNIPEVIDARQQARDASAHTLFSKDFKQADKKLTDVTSDLEKNNTKSAFKNQAQLQADYRELELKSITETSLGSAIETIRVAKKEDGKRYAPRSLAIAEKKVKDTNAFIIGNRRSTSEIKLRSEDAIKAANHLLKITRDVKAGKNESGEDSALAIESEQEKTAMTQNQLDASQAEVLYQEGQVRAEISNTKAAHKQNEQLELEKVLNTRFEAAQKEFTKNEAEVYKQNNNLVIRLRGLEFESAKSHLKGSNFPLLAKVQKVIKDFGEPTIVIEGYTDTDGSKKSNQLLSTNRAEAVKEYFVSAAGIDEDSIKAIGHGDSMPLAPNDTARGKAQNRRVDVIITPTTTHL